MAGLLIVCTHTLELQAHCMFAGTVRGLLESLRYPQGMHCLIDGQGQWRVQELICAAGQLQVMYKQTWVMCVVSLY